MTSPKSPEEKLAAQEALIRELRNELALAEAKLAGMLDMLTPTNRPSSAIAPPITSRRMLSSGDLVGGFTETTNARQALVKSSAPASKGRQPGAISHQWRNALGLLYMTHPDGFTEHTAARAAAEVGLEGIRPKDALERLTTYMPHKYVERITDISSNSGKFKVTEFAAEKYGFQRSANEAPHSEGGEAS